MSLPHDMSRPYKVQIVDGMGRYDNDIHEKTTNIPIFHGTYMYIDTLYHHNYIGAMLVNYANSTHFSDIRVSFPTLERLWVDDNKLSDPTTFAILAGLRRYIHVHGKYMYTSISIHNFVCVVCSIYVLTTTNWPLCPT